MSPLDDEIELLRLENEKLRDQNLVLRQAEVVASPSESRRRFRRASSWVVLVLACLVAAVSVLVVFVRNEALNTETYVATMQPLASDPAIQNAVADVVSTELIAKTDAKQRVANALPAKAAFLATPITYGLQSAVRQITLTFVQSSAFQKVWTVTNRNAHQQLVALLTGSGTGALSANKGEVTLDLGKVLTQVKKKLDGQGITIFDKVPTTSAPSFVVFKSEQLVKLQSLVRTLNRAAFVLPIITIGLLVGAVLLAIDRRRGLVRAATGLAIAMATLLVAFDIGRNQYLSALGTSVSHAAAASAYDTVAAVPLGTIRTVLAVAVVVALVGVVAGNGWLRARVRGITKPAWLAEGPLHQFVARYRKALQWAAAGLGVLVLLGWENPTPLAVIVVVLVTLAIMALIGVLGSRQGGGDQRPVIGTGVG